MFTLAHTHARYLALGARFGVVLGPQRRLLRFPGVATWEIFEVLDLHVCMQGQELSSKTLLQPIIVIQYGSLAYLALRIASSSYGEVSYRRSWAPSLSTTLLNKTRQRLCCYDQHS